jgi:hypothetical protein
MSRASRLDTVLLSQALDIPDGERANYRLTYHVILEPLNKIVK